MKQNSVFRAVLNLALVSATGLLVACGSDSSTPAPAPVDASISGTIVAAPVNGAGVSVVDGNGNVVVEAVQTDATGQYSLTIPADSLAQDLIVKSTGGTFTDEATGTAGTVAGEMYTYASANSISDGGSVSVTPGSTIIASMVMNGQTMADAEAAFSSAFGYTPDMSVTPVDATVVPAADASEASKLAGLRAAAFSQLATDLGLAPAEQFDLLTAVAADLADGTLDGMGAGGAVSVTPTVMLPVDIQNRFVTSLLNFHNDGLMGDTHGNDMTGLDNSQIGMLPFAKVATTGLTAGAYTIEYVPGMMDAMQGKTMFTLRISDDSGNPVSSTVELMLMMNMEDRRHSTPDMDCTESGTAGTYDCTVYYVMPSVMATGDSMGYWQIQVMVDMKSALFYPKVMMAMGDTTRSLLKGIIGVDTISMMGDTLSRPYNLFRNGLSGTTGSHDFELFLAPMETMMSFPTLATGLTLNGSFLVSDVKVEFSTDETNWFEATYVGTNGSGIWGITGLAGLTDGVEGKIYVKLSVDSDASGTFELGELKTTDGLAAGGMNEYATFRVTP